MQLSASQGRLCSMELVGLSVT